MVVSAQGLLSRTFIDDALTQEVHQLLSSPYVRKILEALVTARDGLTARWIDIHIVGEEGSGKTAYVTLNRLGDAGWASYRGPRGSRIWSVTDRGRKALLYAREGDSIGNGGVGAR